MVAARLVIVEGIMGSGKSTTTQWIAANLERAHQQARAVTELTIPHPIRATDGLAHWYEPWLDVTPGELVERSLAQWRYFVESHPPDTVTIVDGQLVRSGSRTR